MTHALRSEKVTMYSGGVLLRRGIRLFVRIAEAEQRRSVRVWETSDGMQPGLRNHTT
jgi:hypothetical protein